MTIEQKLREQFPILRTEQEVFKDIRGNPRLLRTFHSWPDERRREFLNFCTGARGVKMVYATFFKEVMNPEYTPDRKSVV